MIFVINKLPFQAKIIMRHKETRLKEENPSLLAGPLIVIIHILHHQAGTRAYHTQILCDSQMLSGSSEITLKFAKLLWMSALSEVDACFLLFLFLSKLYQQSLSQLKVFENSEEHSGMERQN